MSSKKTGAGSSKQAHIAVVKKTSIGLSCNTRKRHKDAKRSFKRSRGQGHP